MTVPHDREIPDWFDRIPKVELHCHVEGTVRPTTVIELAAKAGRPLPVDDPAELYRYDSLDSFLAVFWLVQETLVSPEDWARIAYESLVDGAAHGLRYSSQPHIHNILSIACLQAARSSLLNQRQCPQRERFATGATSCWQGMQ